LREEIDTYENDSDSDDYKELYESRDKEYTELTEEVKKLT